MVGGVNKFLFLPGIILKDHAYMSMQVENKIKINI